jgi:hypothetical protein
MLAIKTCKEQLKEKDDRIQKLTDQYKQYRQQSQREAQLMSSAIYEVSLTLNLHLITFHHFQIDDLIPLLHSPRIQPARNEHYRTAAGTKFRPHWTKTVHLDSRPTGFSSEEFAPGGHVTASSAVVNGSWRESIS